MFVSLATRKVSAFVTNTNNVRDFLVPWIIYAKQGQAEVILVGFGGTPYRGMWWYAVQMLEDK